MYVMVVKSCDAEKIIKVLSYLILSTSLCAKSFVLPSLQPATKELI